MRYVLSLACLLLSVASIGQSGHELAGRWYNHDFGFEMTLFLKGDGTGEFDGDPIQYKVQGRQLLMTISGETIVYQFQQSGNSLTLSGGDLDGPIELTRGGTDSKTVTVPSESNEDKTNVSVKPQSSHESIVGRWSGSGETIEFTQNGECNYLGQTYGYQLSTDMVTLVTSQGNVVFRYMVQGDQLTLSGNNNQVVYHRQVGGESPTPTGNPSKGSVPAELAGVWCYVNVSNTNTGGSSTTACITLNGDGTYSYSSEGSMSVNTNTFYGGTNSQGSDRGTWYVQGDRIYYNSPTRGQGSYQLQKMNHPKNGDPMIVLDGTAYVTQYQKPPWR